jgi:hypothetical protein
MDESIEKWLLVIIYLIKIYFYKLIFIFYKLININLNKINNFKKK